MNRRNFIKTGTLLTGATSVVSNIYQSSESKLKSNSSFKVAFISDIHVKPDEISQTGMRKALKHVNNLGNKPSFIINGGDSIMDSLAANKAETQSQWDVWNKIMEEENKLQVYHCIGNHDIWGWQVKDDTIKSDPLYDKYWVIRNHGMSARYYSFEKNEWHFIVLDSTQENEGGYIARFSQESGGLIWGTYLLAYCAQGYPADISSVNDSKFVLTGGLGSNCSDITTQDAFQPSSGGMFDIGFFIFEDATITSTKNPEILPLTIYPNPTRDAVRVEIPGQLFAPMALQVYDLTGRIVLEQGAYQSGNMLNVSALSPGLYVVKGRQGEQGFSSKLVLQ